MTKDRVVRVIWWVMVCVSAVGLVFAALSFREVENPFLIFPIAAETAVGAVVARKRPGNPMGWVFLGVGVLTGVLIMSAGLTEVALSTSGELPWWGLISAWFASWLWYPLLYLLSTLTLLLYPSGLLSRRWRPVLWLSIIATACFTVVAALLPVIPVAFDPEGGVTRTVANPISPPFMSGTPSLEDSPAAGVLGTIFMGFLLAAVVSSILRVKRSTGVEREQMRWFGFAIALIILLILIEATLSDLIPQVWLSLGEALVLSFFVVSCGIAILRYQLYDIDRIISRSTSYVLVTGLVVVVYLGVVAAASAVMPVSDTLPVAFATLMAAAVFRPALRWTQTRVDRRFDRSRFDAEQTVQSFANGLRAEVDPDWVSRDLLAVLDRTMQPSVSGVWLRDK